MAGVPSAFGRDLVKEWNLNARGYFDKAGSWYHIPASYPAAYCDLDGYVLFKSDTELQSCPQIKIGVDVHVEGGISSLPSYKKMR